MLFTSAVAGAERVLIDPTASDPSGLTTLDSWQPDREGARLAFQLSSGGREESELSVMDIATGQVIDGPIDRCRYSGVAWLPGGKAFYYVRRLPADQVPGGESQYHRRVYLHTVGTAPETDALVFGEGRDKTSYYGVSVSRDGHWLVVSASIGTAPRDDVWIADLADADPAQPPLVPAAVGLDAEATPRPPVLPGTERAVHATGPAPRESSPPRTPRPPGCIPGTRPSRRARHGRCGSAAQAPAKSPEGRCAYTWSSCSARTG